MKTPEKAMELKEVILSGKKDFSEVAFEHSLCPSGKSNGGYLGEFQQGVMVPQIDAICWAAPLKQLQGPIASQFGLHLLEVLYRDHPPKPVGPRPPEVEFKPSSKRNKAD